MGDKKNHEANKSRVEHPAHWSDEFEAMMTRSQTHSKNPTKKKYLQKELDRL
jgi:hypothetical protein